MIDNKTKIVITGEDRTKAAFSSVNRQMGTLKNNVAALARGFGGLFGALSVGGLAVFAKSGIDAADSLNDLSDRIGVSVKDLASFKLAAQLADTSLEGVGKGIARLSRSIGDAESGNKKLAGVLKQLGISARDPKEAFFQLADATQRITDPAQRASLLNQVLGKSYQELVPLLQQGGDALRESAAQSETFADSMVRLAPEAAKFNDQLDELKQNAQGFAAGILVDAVPALNEFIKRVQLVKGLIGAGGLFNTLTVTGGTDDLNEVTRRLNKSIADTQRAIDGDGRKGKDTSGFEEKLRGLKAQRDLLIDIRTAEAQQPPKTETQRLIKADRARVGGGQIDLSAAGADAGAAAAAARERKAAAAAALALRAEQSTQAARLEQDDLARQIDINKQAFDGKLIDATDYYAALTELQRQQADSEIALLQSQRAAAEAISGGEAERLKAQADIVKIATEIELVERRTASQAVANAASRQAVAAALKLQQDDFLEGVEQEAFLSSLSNDERETALLLLEAEKLGIADVNRLLELQGQIRQAANDRQVAEELKRQQDDLYKSVQEGVQRAFADGLNAVAAGAGGIRAALLNIVDTIRKALSNAIAGSLTESFLGMLGGKEGVLNIAGSLGLGGKRDGSTPTSAIFVRDVAAGGALPGATGEGGGMFAGFFDGIKSFFSSIAGGLSNLFSGLTRSLSGLFSGGGGGGGAGLFSAIAGAFGFADGGFTGPGGKYQPAGVVHAGEYVFSADSVRRLGLGALDNLHRIASGSMIPRAPRWGYAEGGLVNLPGSVAPTVNANTKIVNAFDMDSAFAEYLNTRGGERAILNVIQRNPGAAGA